MKIVQRENPHLPKIIDESENCIACVYFNVCYDLLGIGRDSEPCDWQPSRFQRRNEERNNENSSNVYCARCLNRLCEHERFSSHTHPSTRQATEETHIYCYACLVYVEDGDILEEDDDDETKI
jgi:hypothetical protein